MESVLASNEYITPIPEAEVMTFSLQVAVLYSLQDLNSPSLTSQHSTLQTYSRSLTTLLTPPLSSHSFQTLPTCWPGRGAAVARDRSRVRPLDWLLL
ncbi:hypothetical protein E2C01_083290 [Portunus trituberculatus]|uniref:Uncharacterized protein n=1 Tax=Portunus trituberculatus TaxID=210409 RepID=A0A5B7J1C9_PORTR|nr:hypothetical protein [Portunus trituberculatus]